MGLLLGMEGVYVCVIAKSLEGCSTCSVGFP